MASSSMLRAGNFCHAGNFHYINMRSDSHIKTLPVKFMGANPCLKITTQERARLHAPFSNVSTVGAVSAGQSVTATVQVQLINGDNEDPANVYGRITASNTGNSKQVTLFDRNSHNYINVKPQGMIPLINYTVAVPKNSSITITADLYDQDDFSPDDPIAQGSVTMPAASSGIKIGGISGKYGFVQVIVSWAP